jgi:hypothetical protein
VGSGQSLLPAEVAWCDTGVPPPRAVPCSAETNPCDTNGGDCGVAVKGGPMECTCHPGYHGDICAACSAGYFLSAGVEGAKDAVCGALGVCVGRAKEEGRAAARTGAGLLD